MKANPNRQLSSAAALLQLLADYPELPALDWGIAPQGRLSGALFSLEDPQAVAGKIVAALGGACYESRFTSQKDGLPHLVVYLDVVWRDVPISVTLGGAAALASTAVTA